jgi:hypothetical protein
MPVGYTTYYAGLFADLVAQQSAMATQEEATLKGTLVLKGEEIKAPFGGS